MVPGREFLGNENGEGLRAAAIPIIDASQDGVLIVEVVVEDDDEGGIKGEVLLERVCALHLDGHLGDTIGKEDVSAIAFVGLRSPVVGDGGTVRLKREIAGHGGGRGRLPERDEWWLWPPRPPPLGVISNSSWPMDFAVEKNLEFPFVGDEDGACGRFFLGGVSEESAASESNRDEQRISCGAGVCRIDELLRERVSFGTKRALFPM